MISHKQWQLSMTSQTRPRLDIERALPIFVLTFVDILGLTIILPLLHLYAVAFGATPMQIGLVAAAFPLAQLIGVPVMGALSDRYGRKPLLLISQITTCISFIMLASANSLEIIILSRVIDGLFGANIATAQAALTDITTDETRAQGLGLTGAAFGLGFIFGPLISIIALEVTDKLYVSALIAACYSFVSILLTAGLFKETLPLEKRGLADNRIKLFAGFRFLAQPQINVLLVLMFAQQVIFYGFESLLGLFVLSRLGLLGQGNGLIFFIVGVVLVTVQVRYIGKWTRKYGERKLVFLALGLLSIGLLLIAFTPAQPNPFYVRQIVENDLRDQRPSGAEAILGTINITLPENENRGLGGVAWMLVAIIPVAVGAGIIRPGLNSLMTRRVSPNDYGSVLGVSAAFVSAANAIAPLLGAFLFELGGASLPFLVGGLLMGFLLMMSVWVIQPLPIIQSTNL